MSRSGSGAVGLVGAMVLTIVVLPLVACGDIREQGEGNEGSGTGGSDEVGTAESTGATDFTTEGQGCAGICGSPGCGPCPDRPMIAGSGYRIDRTEVSVGAYGEFLAVDFEVGFLAEECLWKSDWGGFEPELWSEQLDADADNPVTGVDWCDAESYCRWSDRRLCGLIGGGAPDLDQIIDADNEWFDACTDAGANAYPYGDNYEELACNGADLGAAWVVPVASLPACKGGLEDLRDMSGNVWEWTAACGDGPDLQEYEKQCRRRGGSWVSDPFLLRCGVDSTRTRAFRATNTGIRCCADP